MYTSLSEEHSAEAPRRYHRRQPLTLPSFPFVLFFLPCTRRHYIRLGCPNHCH